MSRTEASFSTCNCAALSGVERRSTSRPKSSVIAVSTAFTDARIGNGGQFCSRIHSSAISMVHLRPILAIVRWSCLPCFVALGFLLYGFCYPRTTEARLMAPEITQLGTKSTRNYPLPLFTIMLRYYCTNLTTEGLWLLDGAKVFTVAPLLVQTISLGDKVLPPPSIARHAGFWSGSMFAVVVFCCLVCLLCGGSGAGVVPPFEEVLCLPPGY